MHWVVALAILGGVLAWGVAGAARDFRAEIETHRARIGRIMPSDAD